MANSPNPKANQQEKFLSKTFKHLNKFRVGFFSGCLATILLAAGASHLVFNIFKFGQISFGNNSSGTTIGSPTTSTTQSGDSIKAGNSTEQADLSTTNSEDTIQASNSQVEQQEINDSEVNQQEISDSQVEQQEISDSNVNQQESDRAVGSNIVAEGDVNVTITYRDNSELPGFNAGKGYLFDPPDISQFNDALLISDVSFGPQHFESSTQDVFILGTRYQSTFHLEPNRTEETRVAFRLDTIPRPKGIFLQFGLGDWSSGSTTLTYLVKISADSQPLWSGQIKYAESQIASVVLDVEDYQDIFIEYQIVEQGGASPYQNPLYFTEAQLLFN